MVGLTSVLWKVIVLQSLRFAGEFELWTDFETEVVDERCERHAPVPMKITGTVEAVLQLKGWNVCSVGPEDTVFEAIRRMAEANVGALVVLEGGKLIGVISERDYTRKVALQGRNSKQTSVREILTGNPYTVSPETSVEECLKIMSEKKIRHLPVLRGDAVVGVISVSDLVDWIMNAQRAAIDQLESYISGRYPA